MVKKGYGGFIGEICLVSVKPVFTWFSDGLSNYVIKWDRSLESSFSNGFVRETVKLSYFLCGLCEKETNFYPCRGILSVICLLSLS